MMVFAVFSVPVLAAGQHSLSKTSVTVEAGKDASIKINGLKKGESWSASADRNGVVQLLAKGNTLKIRGLSRKVNSSLVPNTTVITVKIGNEELKCNVTVTQELYYSDFNYAGENLESKTDKYNSTNYIDRVIKTDKEDSVNSRGLDLEPRRCKEGTSMGTIINKFGNKTIEDVTQDDDAQYVGDYNALLGFSTKLTYSYYDNSTSRMFYITFYFNDHSVCQEIVYHCEGIPKLA